MFKSCNISYSAFPVCKSLALPMIAEAFSFGTEMTDPVWQRAAWAEDIVTYPRNTIPEKPSRFAAFRTADALCIGFFFTEAPADRTYQAQNGDSLRNRLWTGDLAELHFGALEGTPWKSQLIVGIDGERFDFNDTFNAWDAKVFENEDGWGAEVRIPLELLNIDDNGLYFEFCRQALKRGEYSLWCPQLNGFHEIENYGELLFGSYAEIAALRYGTMPPGAFGRTEFETLRARKAIPATTVTQPPWLTNPEPTAITVNFQTAGQLPAYVEYWPANDETQRRKAECSRHHGILYHERTHQAFLTNLLPDTEYRYEPFVIPMGGTKGVSTGIVRSFRNLPLEPREFSFYALADLHSNIRFLRSAMSMKQAQEATFLLLLGDYPAQTSSGEAALLQSIVQPIQDATRNRPCDLPMVVVAGNHDQLGMHAKDFYRLFRHPSGRTWHTFSCGNVFFIVLDNGSDHLDLPDDDFHNNTGMLAEENAFLREVVASAEYRQARFRVLATHIPPLDDVSPDIVTPLLEPLVHAEVKPDVMLNGHAHHYAKVENNRFAPTSEMCYLNGKRHIMELPWPTLISSLGTAIHCRATKDALEFQVLLPEGQGKLIDSLRIE